MLNWGKNSCFCLVVCGPNFISDAPLTNSETMSEPEPETEIYYLIKRCGRSFYTNTIDFFFIASLQLIIIVK